MKERIHRETTGLAIQRPHKVAVQHKHRKPYKRFHEDVVAVSVVDVGAATGVQIPASAASVMVVAAVSVVDVGAATGVPIRHDERR